MSYDTWLNRPYETAYAESERFYEWCETMDLDPDGKGVLEAYEDFLLEMAETWAEEQAEARYERQEDDYYEREEF